MLILGNGLTAAIALKIFPNAEAVYDLKNQSVPHRALLRFRSDAISKLTGIPFKKVRVYKGIYSNDYFCPPNIEVMNLYSQKVTGGLYDRSIADISPAERFIAPRDFYDRLINSVSERMFIESDVSQFTNRFELDRSIITTLPMQVNQLIFPVDQPIQFYEPNSNSIFVNRFKIPKCDVYQTIYYPDEQDSIYRASIEGDELICESIVPITETSLEVVKNSFGIKEIGESIITNYEQKIGKMVKIDEEYRQRIISQMTKIHNVYSLGRVACWRPSVLLDDVLKDLYTIRDMIELTPYERAMRWK
jgi:hypothetical protein